MKVFMLPLAVMASSVMAQTTTCGADYIVETCLGSEKAKVDACKIDDYDCLCAGWKSLLTCYNNCPNDPRLHSSAGQRDIFCGYASQFPSNQPTQGPSQTLAAPAQNTQNAGANQGDSTGGDNASATTSSSGPADTNSAASLALNAGGVLAAVAGVFAVVL